MVTSGIAYAADVSLKVDGTDIPDETMQRVVEVVVEQALHLPTMITIRLNDIAHVTETPAQTPFRLMDQEVFPIGGQITVDMGQTTEPGTVARGEITGLDFSLAPDGPAQLVVRGYARSHRLHRGRYSRSFQNMTDSDIASKIAREAGLTPTVDTTSQVHKYLFQQNQTNWEFLRARAAHIGYELYVDGQNLYFRKPGKGKETGPTLNFGDNLISFQVRLSTAYQAAEVSVRGWDPDAKQAVVGTATSGQLAPETGLAKTGAQLASTFGQAKVAVVGRPVATQDEAQTLAQAIYDNLDGTFLQAEGVCLGNPAIRPGVTVTVSDVGSRLSGKYYVTAATHRFTIEEGYTTTFSVNGRQSGTLLELVGGRNESGALPSVVTALVTDNTDPDGNQGRVKVKFPWLADNDQSWWARLASPMAGSGRGFYFLPEVNDEVLVSFEHGDITRPYVLGVLWNGQDAPPKTNSEVVADSKVNERLIKTRAGHILSFDDTENAETISIIDKTGKNLIKITSSDNKVLVQSEGDVVVQAKQKVQVTADGDATVDVKGNATVKSSQNVEVTAQGHATVSASGNATVSAQANLELKGAMVKVEAQGTMTIQAQGPLTLKGAIVNIN